MQNNIRYKLFSKMRIHKILNGTCNRKKEKKRKRKAYEFTMHSFVHVSYLIN